VLTVSACDPLPLDSLLLELDNCIIAPHTASANKIAREKMAWLAAKNT